MFSYVSRLGMPGRVTSSNTTSTLAAFAVRSLSASEPRAASRTEKFFLSKRFPNRRAQQFFIFDY
jgi:hypothetical protein